MWSTSITGLFIVIVRCHLPSFLSHRLVKLVLVRSRWLQMSDLPYVKCIYFKITFKHFEILCRLFKNTGMLISIRLILGLSRLLCPDYLIECLWKSLYVQEQTKFWGCTCVGMTLQRLYRFAVLGEIFLLIYSWPVTQLINVSFLSGNCYTC